MKDNKRKRESPLRVREPVQVYLHPDDQDRLARLTDKLATSKSDVLRRGLEALEREVSDPAGHPALKLVGLGASDPAADPLDAAREHDRALADAEVPAWAREREDRRGA